MPNLTTAGLNYNYKADLPIQSIMSQAPIMKFDYQPFDEAERLVQVIPVGAAGHSSNGHPSRL